MITLLSLLVTLGILITVHEYGHFWVARKCGVKVLRFSIGFGRPLIKWHDRQGTEFVIAALPLGGYVKMLDARESPIDDAEKSSEFTGKPVIQRIAIVAAGPLANFLFAILAYWALFMVGVNGIKPYVSGVEPGSAADLAGLQGEFFIASIDNKQVDTWEEVQVALFSRIGDTGEILLVDGQQQSYQLAISQWMSGEELVSPIESLGMFPFGSRIDAIIDHIEPGSAAEDAGLLVGDQIRSVDGVEVTTWSQLVDKVQSSPNIALNVEVIRGEWVEQILIKPKEREGKGFLGVSPVSPDLPDDIFVTVRKNPFQSMLSAVSKTWDTISISFSMFGKMVSGLISPDNIGGPISIAKMAGQSAQSGFESFISFLAFISISLGVVNLLPIPVLDGGHLMYYVIEFITGKPLSDRIQAFGFRMGAALLMCLMAFAILNDITRLF